jgi:hypothetical protein
MADRAKTITTVANMAAPVPWRLGLSTLVAAGLTGLAASGLGSGLDSGTDDFSAGGGVTSITGADEAGGSATGIGSIENNCSISIFGGNFMAAANHCMIDITNDSVLLATG